MAQNITLMGASYSAVPAVTLPKTGGGTATFTDTSDATLDNGNKMLSGNTAYSNGTKYTGSIPSKSAQTYTPTTTAQTIASGQYLTGAQTIAGDANLLAENIKKDIVLFGVTGTYEGSGGGSMEYDIVIRCTNAGFGNTVSNYVLEHIPTASDIMAKVSANEPFTGILYCTNVDTVEEPTEYEYTSWPLFSVDADEAGYWGCVFMRPKSTNPYYQSKAFHFNASNNLYSVS